MNRLFASLTVVVAISAPAWADTTVVAGTNATKQVLHGRIVTPTTILTGDVVIEGDTITCVAVTCATPAGASVFTVTNGYIYPGFIDAHNHVAYNVLPKWTPPKLYQHRSQWQGATAYKNFKQPYDDLKGDGLFCQMVKWGELKALLSGVTTIEGTAPNQTCFRTLIRNAENQNELGTPASLIRTFILDISSFKSTINWTVTKSFVVHLGEGIDATAKAEFQTLKHKNLLRAETVIIHGSAFDTAEFREMGQVGAKLVWSPQSNKVLYGQTTNIPLALQSGVSVSLGVDWNPTGSNTLLDELRVAAEFNHTQFNDVIAEADWLPMITTHPAQALALDTRIGQLAPGFKADVTVLRSQGADPHKSLLANHPQDVEMVWVGGQLLYGREPVLQGVKPNQCEAIAVNGVNQRICVKDTINPVPGSTQTLADIRAALLARYAQLSPLVP